MRTIGAKALLTTLAVVVVAGCSGSAPGTPSEVRIAVDRAAVLADEVVAITVDGLVPGSVVALWARRVDGLDRPWLAYAEFTADAGGAVDLRNQAPSAGTYSGVDPMGLFRSVRLAGGTPAGPPFPVDPVSAVTLTAQVGGVTVAHTSVQQRVAAVDVTQREVREDGVVGVLYEPPGPGPHPGVVLLGGSDGGIPAYPVAGLLASRGFSTLALGYFGADGLPAELTRIPLEYFDGAFRWLTAQPHVGDGRVGVVGASRGGELALLLGATFPQVGAVVSYVGSGLGYAGLPASGYATPMPPAWTLHGEDVPFVSPSFDTTAILTRYVLPLMIGAPIPDVAGTWPDVLAAGPQAMASATIPVERIDGPVLLVSGRDDRLWPSTQLSGVAEERLRGHPWPHEHVAYPGAGHFFFGLPPYAGPYPTALGASSVLLAGGGSAEANAAAATDAWPRLLRTLHDGLDGR